jgi:hypothetical protein
MPLPGRCLCAGNFLPYYGAINVAPTQRDQPSSLRKKPHFRKRKRHLNEQEFVNASWRYTKPRTTELARSCSNLQLCYSVLFYAKITNGKWVRILKEAFMSYFKLISQNFPGDTEENNSQCVRIQNGCFQKRSQKHCRYENLIGLWRWQ